MGVSCLSSTRVAASEAHIWYAGAKASQSGGLMSIRISLRKVWAFFNRLEILPGMQVRLWPLLLGLLIVLFPFDWLGEVWPWYASIFNVVFATVFAHEIGHTTIFFLLGLLVLLSVPTLLTRPALYFGLLLVVALGQEAIQALAKQHLPSIYDGRDLLFDLTGVVVAYLLVFTGHWLFLKKNITA